MFMLFSSGVGIFSIILTYIGIRAIRLDAKDKKKGKAVRSA